MVDLRDGTIGDAQTHQTKADSGDVRSVFAQLAGGKGLRRRHVVLRACIGICSLDGRYLVRLGEGSLNTQEGIDMFSLKAVFALEGWTMSIINTHNQGVISSLYTFFYRSMAQVVNMSHK